MDGFFFAWLGPNHEEGPDRKGKFSGNLCRTRQF
jgi:hypothetical protein